MASPTRKAPTGKADSSLSPTEVKQSIQPGQTPSAPAESKAKSGHESYEEGVKEEQANEDCFTKARENVCGDNILGTICCECCCCPCMCISGAEFTIAKATSSFFNRAKTYLCGTNVPAEAKTIQVEQQASQPSSPPGGMAMR